MKQIVLPFPSSDSSRICPVTLHDPLGDRQPRALAAFPMRVQPQAHPEHSLLILGLDPDPVVPHKDDRSVRARDCPDLHSLVRRPVVRHPVGRTSIDGTRRWALGTVY